MTYKRIPGGEITPKSGVPWTKDEIEEVYKLYIEIEGKGIHEHNKKIQQLAAKLERAVRATEAQLLMFRALSKGKNYSRKNMNKICEEVWEVNEGQIGNITIENKMNSKLINQINDQPDILLTWAGHQSGGVRKPFTRDSGRPSGTVIRTKLVNKIDVWVNDLVKGNSVPRILLLIGGPGNGKTDALEYLIDRLDLKTNNLNQFYDSFSKIFQPNSGNIPRIGKVELIEELNGLNRIEIVQDASVGEKLESKEECLLQDLKRAGDNLNTIYIACVNKGILSDSISYANKLGHPQLELLQVISENLSATVNFKSLWPLEANETIAIWPMDVESLVKPLSGKTSSPFHEIVISAINQEKWQYCSSCLSAEYCPFYLNITDLSKEDNLDNLARILHRFEIVSSKRFSFRDLYSLVAQLIIGHEDDFGSLRPCKWIHKQIEDMNRSHIDFKSIFNLSSHLYPNQLFSEWPKFTQVSKGNSYKNAFAFIKQSDGSIKNFFSVLGYRKHSSKSHISSLLTNQLAPNLDPAAISGEELKYREEDFTISKIEDLFSNSISLGVTPFKMHLNSLESKMFYFLENAEFEIHNINSNKSLNSQFQFIENILKSFACRYLKRILGTKNGITKDHEFLGNYIKLMKFDNKKDLRSISKLFEKLLHEDERFVISLTNTFGQPTSEAIRNTYLKVKKIELSESFPNRCYDGVPRNYFPIISILGYNINITYVLYKSLCKIDTGLNQSSLPSEIKAMLDSLVSKVGGKIVRDPNYLRNSQIVPGMQRFFFEVDGTDLDFVNTKSIY